MFLHSYNLFFTLLYFVCLYTTEPLTSLMFHNVLYDGDDTDDDAAMLYVNMFFVIRHFLHNTLLKQRLP